MIVGWILSLASAGLLVLVFPPFGYVYLAPFALAPLLIAAALEDDWRRRFAMGYVPGIVYWFGVCHWIQWTLEHHGGMGGTLAWLLPRIDRFWETGLAERKEPTERPSLAARGFYCDTLTFDAVNLQLVAQRFGSDHLLVGSDYPFGVMEDPPGLVLGDTAFDEGTKDLIRAHTFRRLAAHVAGPA